MLWGFAKYVSLFVLSLGLSTVRFNNLLKLYTGRGSVVGRSLPFVVRFVVCWLLA